MSSIEIQEDIFEINNDSDHESGYYIANITRKQHDIYQIEDTDESDSDATIESMDMDEILTNDIQTERSSRERRRNSQTQSQINLPPPPPFNHLNHQHLLHESDVNLPYEYSILDSITPWDIFRLFFSNEILRVIANNTNKYGRYKNEDSW